METLFALMTPYEGVPFVPLALLGDGTMIISCIYCLCYNYGNTYRYSRINEDMHEFFILHNDAIQSIGGLELLRKSRVATNQLLNKVKLLS